MPLPDLPAHSGDGHPGRPPVPVLLAVVPATDVGRSPRLPLFVDRVPAGFPSPADDYTEAELDLHELLGIASPSCFFVQAAGWSQRDAGIFDGDVLVVDRAVEPASGMLVVAALDGELTLKRFVREGAGARARAFLVPSNPECERIELVEGQELVVWGVVTHSVRFHLPLRGVRRAAT